MQRHAVLLQVGAGALIHCRSSGDKLSIQYTYASSDIHHEDVQLTLESPGVEYSPTDCIIHMTMNKTEYWSMWAHGGGVMSSVTSNYTKKRLWLMCLAKITKKSTANTRTKQESSMSNDALYHSFSSPSHLYFSVNGVEGIHFVEDQIIPQPSVVTKDEANSDSKVCSNCSSRILFSAKQCYRCGKAFCKNCCNQRVLDRSGRDD